MKEIILVFVMKLRELYPMHNIMTEDMPMGCTKVKNTFFTVILSADGAINSITTLYDDDALKVSYAYDDTLDSLGLDDEHYLEEHVILGPAPQNPQQDSMSTIDSDDGQTEQILDGTIYS
jgi:hypothetical protein